MEPAEHVQSKLSPQMLLAFLFGVIFILLILWLVYQTPGDDRFKKMVFLIVLSLAAGGVGGILPGYITAGPPNKLIRAGGALAVFIVVLYVGMPFIPSVQEIYVPTNDPSIVANEFTAFLEQSNFEKAYELTSDTFKASVSKYMFGEGSRRVNAKLGNTQHRAMVFQNIVKSPAGLPPGAYCYTTYTIRIEGVSSEIYLNMTLVGEQAAQDWRVFNLMYAFKNFQGNVLPVDFSSPAPIP
jgi:hypothetical protein